MATQTEANVQAEISARIAIFEEMRKAAASNSSGSLSNYIAREQTAQNLTAGDYTEDSNGALKRSVRAQLNAALSSSSVRAVLIPLFRNYAKVDGAIAEADPLPRIYQRFINNSLKVKSRNITFASPAAGSNLGNGTVNRLSVDAYGYNIEATHIEAKKAECTRDSNLGTPLHEEEFLFSGAVRNVDQLAIAGSGFAKTIAAFSARRSLLANPSFDVLDGTAITSLTSVPNWTVGAEGVVNYNLDRTNFYRGFQGSVNDAALKFLDNGSVQQALSVNSIVAAARPMYLQVAYNRSVGSCNGTLWISLGNASTSVVLAAQSGWQILRIPLNRNLWPQNWAAVAGNTNTVVKIQLQGRTAGTLLVDDVIMVQMEDFDGLWYAPVGGSTAFVAGPLGSHDKFTWTDALAGSDSVIQQWLWRMNGVYLPHVSDSSETWADPSV